MLRACSFHEAFVQLILRFDHRQPGPGGLALLIQEPDVKRGMIGLLHGIGVSHIPLVEQIELFLIGCGSLVGKSDQGRLEEANNIISPEYTSSPR